MSELAKESEVNLEPAVQECSEEFSASDPTQALNKAIAQMEINQKEPWHRDPDSGTDNEADRFNPKRELLRSWLNRLFRIKMTDGRILSGYFVCTDADANVVLQATSEFTEIGGEERVLGLVMIPGRYIVSIEERNPRFSW
ncbi:N-alpha-acetyltransferase 38, NatC auxiliary subunit isoform X2 [Anopheles arabiensis]|uniref:N-alpha-acetyltransferase 38, NatC auxiliary subunit isoform X2 n=1 Tax=Anopheles arabiensis TaxID=7173 RepID=UPI001AADCE10|nr:N-alpha-acetyltransferase 38, NatC auxiliary subunit isoform X2 [Anopheles arabiensis]XP_040226926.1 N-alpha-acetyltransferase 38, NatC auxiliary subunit isoform X2 [Anopheles coluzzii]